MGRLPVRIYSRLSFQYTAAGLFTLRTPSWAQMLIQVQRKRTLNWTTIDTSGLSPMGAFGWRQRLDRILQETNRPSMAGGVTQRLAVWVAKKYEKQHPDQGEVVGVQFGRTIWESKTPELANPSGRWVPDPPMGKPKVPFRSLATYSIAQGVAQQMANAEPMGAATSASIGKRFRPISPKPGSSSATPAEGKDESPLPASSPKSEGRKQ